MKCQTTRQPEKIWPMMVASKAAPAMPMFSTMTKTASSTVLMIAPLREHDHGHLGGLPSPGSVAAAGGQDQKRGKPRGGDAHIALGVGGAHRPGAEPSTGASGRKQRVTAHRITPLENRATAEEPT